MSRINISLVGGQPFPVYAQILDNQPDIAILVCSQQTQKDAERIMSLLGHRCSSIKAFVVKISATDNKQADDVIKSQSEQYCKYGNEITINVAGGTKPWALLFAKHFKNKATIVFIDQNNVVWNLDTLESHHFDSRSISISEIFGLHGVRVRMTPLDEYTDEDKECVLQVKRMRKCNFKAFNKLTMFLAEHPNVSYASHDNCSIEYSNGIFKCHFEYHGKFTKIIDKELSSPHARQILLNSGWFEYEVAQLLQSWSNAENIWLNVNINYEGNSKTVNEIDVIVETKAHKLLFVECKTQVKDSTHIDKFNDVVKKYGGLGSKRIFITEVPLHDLPLDKCEKTRMPHFTTNEVTADDESMQAFFAALDEYMTSINER